MSLAINQPGNLMPWLIKIFSFDKETSVTTCTIEGIIMPSANGAVVIRFASEVGSSAITAKAGSTLRWW